MLLIGLEAVLKRHRHNERGREREREGTNAVYTLAQLPEITASPILPDWNRGGGVKREDGKDAENEENPSLHSLGK